MESSVVVEHVEGGDWALVLTANRTTAGVRYFVPMIFACEGAGIFAACPSLKFWVRTGQVVMFNPPTERREEMLTNAVADFVAAIKHKCNVLERTRVGVVASFRTQAFTEAPPNFELVSADAYRWLFHHPKGENAVTAMRICRYFVEKHGLSRLTQFEKESIGFENITKGELPNVVSRFFQKIHANR